MSIETYVDKAIGNVDTLLSLLTDDDRDLVFDVTESESWSYGNNVTSHAVENGKDVSDQTEAKPDKLKIEVKLTQNTPGGSGNTERINERLELIKKWRNEGTLLTYSGKREEFDSCVIESLSRSENLDLGDGLSLSISLKEIRIANTELVEAKVPPPQQPTKKRGRTSKKSEEGPSKEEVKDTKEEDKSWLASIF